MTNCGRSSTYLAFSAGSAAGSRWAEMLLMNGVATVITGWYLAGARWVGKNVFANPDAARHGLLVVARRVRDKSEMSVLNQQGAATDVLCWNHRCQWARSCSRGDSSWLISASEVSVGYTKC